MDVTCALYELRDQLNQTVEMQAYQKAQQQVEMDVSLQILFGEFEKCKEMSRYCIDEDRKNQMQRAQQIKIKIFENVNFLQLKETERVVNEMRQMLAKELFLKIDPNFKISGETKYTGGCQCEL